MTTARDVIARCVLSAFLDGERCKDTIARQIVDDLLSAPESVRLELVAMLNPWREIETAPKDGTPILAFMWDSWRVAEWDNDGYAKRPRPFWRAWDFQVTTSRVHQPKWWLLLPAPPSEGKP